MKDLGEGRIDTELLAHIFLCSLNWGSILLRPAVRGRGSWDCVHEIISFDNCIFVGKLFIIDHWCVCARVQGCVSVCVQGCVCRSVCGGALSVCVIR